VARTRTLTDMLLDIRQRTNQENSTFVTDAELTEYLNQELAELYTRIVQAQGPAHYRSSSSVSVTSGTALYSLPADLWQVQQVEAVIGGVTWRLRPFMGYEHAPLASTGRPLAYYAPVKYRVQADQIEFLPPTQTFTATVYYTKAPPRLSAGSDTFDGFAGYEVAAIYGACATVLAKEESDPSFYSMQKDRILKHIDSLAGQRDENEPERVQDVDGGDLGWVL